MSLDRRDFLRLSVAGAIGSAGCSQQSEQECPPSDTETPAIDTSEAIPSPPGYPQYNYNRAKTGHNPNSGGPKEDVAVKWKYDAHATSPVVGEDSVYVCASDTLISISEGTGDVQWQSGVPPESVLFAPAVSNGTVLVGTTGPPDSKSGIHAFDSETGGHIWELTVGNLSGISVTVWDESVYAGGGADGGSLYAVDVSDGSVRWRYEIQDAYGYITPASHSTVTTEEFGRTCPKGDSTYDTGSGPGFNSAPTVMYGTIYICSYPPAVRAIDIAERTEHWQYKTKEKPTDPPTVVDGRVYVGDVAGNLYAIDARMGTTHWHRKIEGPISHSAIAGDRLVVGNFAGEFFAINRHTGRTEWKINIGNRFTAAPTIADGVIYVGSNRKRIHAFDLQDGTELWNFQTGRNERQSPAVADDTVYFSSGNGTLYALH